MMRFRNYSLFYYRAVISILFLVLLVFSSLSQSDCVNSAIISKTVFFFYVLTVFVLYARQEKTILIKSAFFIWMLSCFSCKNESRLEMALGLAGDNRAELENELSHSKQNPSDSLKYKAAVFLIENMSYHNYRPVLSEYDRLFDSIQNYPFDVSRKGVFDKMLDSFTGTVRVPKASLLNDIKNVKSDFIINNIELAFKSWYRITEENRASFDEFCNYVLPYRSDNEPLEFSSRESLLKKYSWVYKYIDKKHGLKFVVDSIASEFAFKSLVKISEYYPQPLSISQIEKSRMGLCDDGVNYLVNVFRALGIVSAKDMVPHWGNHHGSGHSWIYVKYGKEEYSTNVQGGNDLKVSYKNESVPKVFRKTFAYNKTSSSNPLVIDVTNTYVKTINLKVENIFDVPVSRPVICVFDRNKGWVPVAKGISKDGYEVFFKEIGGNVLYVVASINENKIECFNYPFYIDAEGDVTFFKPKRSVQDSIILTRKYGLSTPRNKSKLNWLQALNGSFFEGSDEPSFKNSTKLYEISNLNSTQVNSIDIKIKEQFKYVRFNSNGKVSWLAKLAFFDKAGVLLQGDVIKNNTVNLMWENGAYDDDPLSFSGGENFTLGLKFDKPKTIGSIKFQSRNDDNHINIGEDYELFYWNKGWRSLGIQRAKDTVLYYDAPENALLWLQNRTKGKGRTCVCYRRK